VTGAGDTGNGAGVLAESVASWVVALIALLARLGCTSVTAGVWLKKGDGGQTGCCLESRSSAGMYADTSSACVNLCVVATNGLSPETSWGSGEWTKVAGAVGGLATG